MVDGWSVMTYRTFCVIEHHYISFLTAKLYLDLFHHDLQISICLGQFLVKVLPVGRLPFVCLSLKRTIGL